MRFDDIFSLNFVAAAGTGLAYAIALWLIFAGWHLTSWLGPRAIAQPAASVAADDDDEEPEVQGETNPFRQSLEELDRARQERIETLVGKRAPSPADRIAELANKSTTVHFPPHAVEKLIANEAAAAKNAFEQAANEFFVGDVGKLIKTNCTCPACCPVTAAAPAAPSQLTQKALEDKIREMESNAQGRGVLRESLVLDETSFERGAAIARDMPSGEGAL